MELKKHEKSVQKLERKQKAAQTAVMSLIKQNPDWESQPTDPLHIKIKNQLRTLVNLESDIKKGYNQINLIRDSQHHLSSAVIAKSNVEMQKQVQDVTGKIVNPNQTAELVYQAEANKQKQIEIEQNVKVLESFTQTNRSINNEVEAKMAQIGDQLTKEAVLQQKQLATPLTNTNSNSSQQADQQMDNDLAEQLKKLMNGS